RPAESALANWQREALAPDPQGSIFTAQGPIGGSRATFQSQPYPSAVQDNASAFNAMSAEGLAPIMGRAEEASEPVPEAVKHPLGVARGQVAKTYIVAEAEDGLVIVDQHAAHERLVLERMRRATADGAVARQALLLPEVVELDEPACDRLEARAAELTELGLELERFGPAAMLVRAMPALLGTGDAKGLVADLADELAAFDQALSLKER